MMSFINHINSGAAQVISPFKNWFFFQILKNLLERLKELANAKGPYVGNIDVLYI